MAVSAMERQERLEIGEKVFVSSVMLGLLTEAGVGLVGNGLHFTWPGVLFSFVSFVALAGLASWLYSGNRTARQATLAWVAFQIMACAAALIAQGIAQGPLPVLSFVALPAPWLAGIKLLAYAVLGAALLRSRDVQAFLAHQRGEEFVAAPNAADLAPTPTGVTVPLSDEQAESFGTLALLLQGSALVLMIVGVLRLLLGIQAITAALDARVVEGAAVTGGVLTAAEGVVTLLLGVFLLLPAGAVQMVRSEGADTAYVANAAESLKSFFAKQLVLSIILAALLLAGIVLWFLPSGS
jgi:hypothetical protein